MPPLTRSIAVTLRSVPAAGGYDDAYFDSVALVPRVAGAAPHARPAPRAGPPAAPVRRRRRVLSRRAAVDRRRRAWVRLACADRVVRRCTGVGDASRRGSPARASGASRAARSRSAAAA